MICKLRMKEGNVLFNNTFLICLYGKGQFRQETCFHHYMGYFFLISNKSSFISTIPDRTVHTTAVGTLVMEHWLEREISQWVHHEGLIQ